MLKLKFKTYLEKPMEDLRKQYNPSQNQQKRLLMTSLQKKILNEKMSPTLIQFLYQNKRFEGAKSDLLVLWFSWEFLIHYISPTKTKLEKLFEKNLPPHFEISIICKSS